MARQELIEMVRRSYSSVCHDDIDRPRVSWTFKGAICNLVKNLDFPISRIDERHPTSLLSPFAPRKFHQIAKFEKCTAPASPKAFEFVQTQIWITSLKFGTGQNALLEARPPVCILDTRATRKSDPRRQTCKERVNGIAESCWAWAIRPCWDRRPRYKLLG